MFLPEPMTLCYAGMTANSIVLIGHPHKNDDIKSSRTIVEEFRHDGFHSCTRIKLKMSFPMAYAF